jgi:hypothetical protein
VTTDCAHRFEITSVENGTGTIRSIWLKCSLCGDTQRRLSTRTDEEIAEAETSAP